MEEHAVYRVLMVEDDRGIAQAVQTQGELWNLQVRQVRLPLVHGDPPGIPGAGDLYIVCGGQYEHHHGHEPGGRRLHRQAL